MHARYDESEDSAAGAYEDLLNYIGDEEGSDDGDSNENVPSLDNMGKLVTLKLKWQTKPIIP